MQDGNFIIRFYIPVEEAKKEIPQIRLNETQKKIIRFIANNNGANTSLIKENIGITKSLIKRYLTKMKPLLVWTGNTKNDPTGKYILKSNIDLIKLLGE